MARRLTAAVRFTIGPSVCADQVGARADLPRRDIQGFLISVCVCCQGKAGVINMHTGKVCPDGSADDDLKHKLYTGHHYIVLKEETPEASLRLVAEWLNCDQHTALVQSEATLIKLGQMHGLAMMKASAHVNPQISIAQLSSRIISDCIMRIPPNAVFSTTRWVLELGLEKYPSEFLVFYNNYVDPKKQQLSAHHFEESCKAWMYCLVSMV